MIECHSQLCPAMIEFAWNAEDVAAGKDRPRRVPVDVDRSGDHLGTVAVREEEGTGRLLYRSVKSGAELAPGEHLRVSHYTTCAEPGRFSQAGRNPRGKARR